MDLLIQQKPQIFDLNDEYAPGTRAYKVLDKEAYLEGLVANLRATGLCSERDADDALLETMVERGTFRRDLYWRLKVVTITVPPLRERQPDIPALVEAFLDELSRANAVPLKSVTPDALRALEAYHWPGNVRELKNVLESLLVATPGEIVGLEDLPPAVLRETTRQERADLSPGMKLAEAEALLIRRTLEYVGGNRTHSALLLGIGVRTLQRKIRELGLDIPSKRRRPRRRAGLPVA